MASIWLVDLAEQLPWAQLDGYDISSSQFPPAEWLPRNVKLMTLDALAEIPSSLIEKYDVIHVGLLVLVAGDDPMPLLRNLRRMLRLEVVKTHFYPIPNEITHPWTHMHLLSVGELIKNVKDSGGDVKEWWDIYVKAIEEARNGAGIRMGMVVAVGERPCSSSSPQPGRLSIKVSPGK
ncbi:MAG: hypothetical protein LQ338_007578 [Usnochroma carphineum]|nr:MAG: hypothetical protein LQ338_007578 [Usnochroma carphineum]